MVDRPNKPKSLLATPGLPPQAQVTLSHSGARVSAVLPTGESVEVLLHGATVVSWKDAKGEEKLWLSEAAKLDGSKAVRGGVPVVFPVFGTAPGHAQAGKLPQHGFARTSTWDFLGKSTSEGPESSGGGGAGGSSSARTSDGSVKLDFGLSSNTVSEETKKLWPFPFTLIYSVTLDRDSLATSLVVTNEGDQPFDCQVLLHTYLRVKDITKIQVHGLEDSPYVDKVDGLKTKTQSGKVSIAGETDRVYSPPDKSTQPVVVAEGSRKLFTVTRDNLDDVTVWNPWSEKAAGMSDFAPKDGYKNMICVEPGCVSSWQRLEPGDAFEGAQTISYA